LTAKQEEKWKVVNEMLRENPAVRLEEIDKRIIEFGNAGLNIRERILFLERQLSKLSQSKLEGMQNINMMGEGLEAFERLKDSSNRIDQIQDELNRLRKEFKTLTGAKQK